jgi:hypothetical protein
LVKRFHRNIGRQFVDVVRCFHPKHVVMISGFEIAIPSRIPASPNDFEKSEAPPDSDTAEPFCHRFLAAEIDVGLIHNHNSVKRATSFSKSVRFRSFAVGLFGEQRKAVWFDHQPAFRMSSGLS